MKRELWTARLRKYGCAPWPCPSCGKGTLKLDSKSVVSHETALSQSSHNEDEFCFEWVDYRFTAWVVCSNSSCKQKVAVAGIGGVEEVSAEEGWDLADYFEPLFWHPMPPLFEVPKDCPDGVKQSLNAAFALHASDRSACAGRLRVALEALMDHAKIQRWAKNKQGKFMELSLHGRLTRYESKSPIIGKQLIALKWLGNAGSHSPNLSLADLLDAFEVFEHALVEIIEDRGNRVAGLAKSLTKKFARKRGSSSGRQKPLF